MATRALVAYVGCDKEDTIYDVQYEDHRGSMTMQVRVRRPSWGAAWLGSGDYSEAEGHERALEEARAMFERFIAVSKKEAAN